MKKIPRFLTVFLAYSVLTILNGAPDLVPMPKVYKETGQVFQIDGNNVFTEKGNRQGEIAVDELQKKTAELGGAALKGGEIKDISAPGIYILTVKNEKAGDFKKKYQLEITDENPGIQGYVIKVTNEQAVVIGSDSVGALYGAMTLRQMMKKQDGKIIVSSCDVRDWPDFKFRSSMSYARGISQLAFGEKTREEQVAAYKAGVDMMLHFKMNVIFDYTFSRINVWDFDANWKSLASEVNKYALERGIYPSNYDTTAITNSTKDKLTDELKNWKCVKESRHGKMSFHCWSADKMQKEKIEKAADFYKECNFGIVFIHPVDGGAIEDPEMWSHRCPECRKLWKDGERWKATVHQLNMWADIFRKKAPGVILESPIYPYNAVYSNRERFPNVSRELWKQNSIDFWTNVNRELDPSVLTGSWMSARDAMDKYRTCWKGRAMDFNDHYPIDAGIFSTYYRYIITNFYGNPGDMYLSRGTTVYGSWLTLIDCCEFSWNTLSPGNEEFKGLFYDPEKDHTQPDVIMNDWLPMACRNFYGEKVGNLIVKMYQSGIQPYYIVEPGRALERAMDPNNVSKKSEAASIAPDIIDNPARMAFQVKAAEKSMQALEEAWKHYNTMNKYQKKLFIYYYKRMPELYAIARANYADRVAGELQKDGMFDAAAAVLENALKNLKADSEKAQAVKTQIKDEQDIMAPDKLKFGTIPKLSEIKKMIESRLADAKVILKPRRPGRFVNIAVYDGTGAKGTIEFFSQFKNVKAEIISSLNLSVLDKYDCVFIMKTTKISRNDFFNNLRRYVVEGGGGVLIEHDLIGGERGLFGQTNPFPEVCKSGAKRKDGRKVQTVLEHPIFNGLSKGTVMDLMYVDWIVPVAGEDGSVIVADAVGDAVVVAGTVGSGKAVFSGTISVSSIGGGYDAEEKCLYGLNAAIAEGAVEWFAGVKLEKK